MSNKKQSLAESGVKVLYDDAVYFAIACADLGTQAVKMDARGEMEINASKPLYY